MKSLIYVGWIILNSALPMKQKSENILKCVISTYRWTDSQSIKHLCFSRCVKILVALSKSTLGTVHIESYRETRSRTGRFMWGLWCTKRHWDRFISTCFGLSLSKSFHRCSVFTHISSVGRTQGPLEAQFHTIATITMKFHVWRLRKTKECYW